MSNQPAFAEAIRIIVAREIHDALAPYREALASLIEFGGGTPGGVPASPSGEAAPKRRVRLAKSPRTSAASAEVAAKLSTGQKVQYRQGRGVFDAKVIEIDAAKGLVTVERLNDKKQVVRPAAKIIAA